MSTREQGLGPGQEPEVPWTETRYASNGDVRVAYDRLSGSSGRPLLLVMGLGTSRFWWPLGLARALADEGFEVARYDQRDAGQSTRSDVSGLAVARYLRFGLLARLARSKFPEGRAGDIEAGLAVARGVASPAYPFDEAAAREWIEREVDSGPRDTSAQSRQIGAQWHGAKLAEMRTPALVLHGDADPIVRVAAGRRTAVSIDGAKIVVLPGVGHDLPQPLWPAVAREVRELADRAQGAAWEARRPSR